MGHKVHPIGFRIGVTQDWQSKWYDETHYAEFLQEDLKLRQAIQSKYADAAISMVEINRQAKEVSVTIHTARPGIVIGRGGQRVDELGRDLERLIGKRVRLNIMEIRQPELDATLVAKTIAEQIQRRIAYRRAIKQAIFRTIQAGAKGIRVHCAGRLGDAEIARRQMMHEGQVPLQTLRADIDYGFTEAHTTLGRIGIKVWIYKGDILPQPKAVEAEEKPVEMAVAKGAETAPLPTPTEPVEKPVAVAETVASTTALPTAEAKVEKKPAKKPVARKKEIPSEAQKEKAEKLVAAESAEAEAKVAVAEKPVKKPVRRKTIALEAPEKEPEKLVAAESTEVKPEVTVAKKPVRRAKAVTPKKEVTPARAVIPVKEEAPARAAPKRRKKVAPKEGKEIKAGTSAATEEEGKDATT